MNCNLRSRNIGDLSLSKHLPLVMCVGLHRAEIQAKKAEVSIVNLKINNKIIQDRNEIRKREKKLGNGKRKRRGLF